MKKNAGKKNSDENPNFAKYTQISLPEQKPAPIMVPSSKNTTDKFFFILYVYEAARAKITYKAQDFQPKSICAYLCKFATVFYIFLDEYFAKFTLFWTKVCFG